MADLLDFSEDQLKSWYQQRKTQVATPPQGTLQVDDPQTLAAIEAGNQVTRTQLPRDYVNPENKRMGQRPGVFLDINRGAPAGVRAKLGLDENQLNQFKFLVGKYGPDNVDISDEGRFVLRNQPAEIGGGTEDVLVDPVGMEGGDVAQFGSQIAPMVASAVAGRFGMKLGNTGFGKAAWGLLAGALGGEVTGAGQDAYVRWVRGNEVDASDIAKHRAKMAAFDLAFGAALAGGSKVALKGAEAMLGLAQVPIGSTPSQLAQKALLERTAAMSGGKGVKFPLTPAEATDSGFLGRVESIAEARPGSAGVFDAILKQKRAAEDELRRIFHGLPREMSDDDLAKVLPQADIAGQHGLQHLRRYTQALEGEKAAATTAIQRTGTAEAQSVAGVSIATPPDFPPVGQALRQRAVTDFQQLRSTMGKRYEDFLSQPEIKDRAVSASGLARDALEVEQRMTPAATQQKGVLSYDTYGNPVERTVEETKRLDAFVEGKVKSFFDELTAMGGAKVSVNDLKQMRTSVDNAIAEGIAIPGTDTARLTAIRDVIDTNLDKALEGIDPAQLAKWEGLKADYSKGMERFNRVGIREMLVKEGEKGALGDTRLAGRVLGSSDEALDNYNAYKEFFGASSTEFKALQDVARQDALFGSIDDLTGYISGAKLRARLSSDSIRPEVAADLFGTSKQELHQIGEVLKQASARNIDTGELAKLARGGSLTASKVQSLIDAETELTRAYNNKLIKGAADGVIDGEKIKPSEFVRHVSQMDPADAQRVMGVLSSNADLVDDIRHIAVEDIWDRARAGVVGKERVRAMDLKSALGNGKKGQEAEVAERTWRVLLGDDTVESLQSLLNAIKFGDATIKGFAGGSIGGASDLAKIALHGEIGAIQSMAARMFVAAAYSGPLRRSVTNLFTKRDHGQVMSALITSEPFVNNLISRFGTDGAMQLMAEYRGLVEPIQRKELMMQGLVEGDLSTLSEAELKEWIQNRRQPAQP